MDQRTDTERIETVVIGGGQSGLSTGYHLARRGIPFVVLDADDRIGDHWRNHYDSLRLYSPARSNGLPGMRFPAASYHYPTGREMGDYLEAYANRFDLPVRSGTRVDGVREADGADGGFVVTAGDRRIEAANVIVATGSFQTPYIPAFAAGLDPAIRQLHSSEYRNPAQLRKGDVLVVGVSHSGADIAYELADSHGTVLSGRSHGELPIRVIDARKARILWPLFSAAIMHVLTLRTPIGRKMAPKVRAGGGPLLRIRSEDLARVGVERRDARTVGVRDGKPMLADGEVLDVTNVIWATGFRQDYDWVEIPGFMGADGWPAGTRGVSHAARGLYVLGVPFTFGFGSMLVAGAGRDAGYVVDRLAERSEVATVGRPIRAASAAR